VPLVPPEPVVPELPDPVPPGIELPELLPGAQSTEPVVVPLVPEAELPGGQFVLRAAPPVLVPLLPEPKLEPELPVPMLPLEPLPMPLLVPEEPAPPPVVPPVCAIAAVPSVRARIEAPVRRIRFIGVLLDR
jgi:hypothetical protein